MTEEPWLDALTPLPEPVRDLLDLLLPGIAYGLDDNFSGAYLRGSLALGGFVPDTSDIDLLALTERPVTADEFESLADMHWNLAQVPHPFATRLEVAYIDRAALYRFEAGRRHPTLGQGEALEWSEHRDNWVLERWTVREHGVTLFGPDPKTLIAPISADELRQAVRRRLDDWAEWADDPDGPDWLLPLSHKRYVVQTMCRALSMLAGNGILSKPRAVAWALETLPEPWRSLVERSQDWSADLPPEPAIQTEVVRFVRWAASEGIIAVGTESSVTAPK